MELLPLLKQFAAMGVTPPAAVALYIMFKLNTSLNGLDKRIALIELTTEKCNKC
jgi:hypothetical protein